jgi:hypothetical protein
MVRPSGVSEGFVAELTVAVVLLGEPGEETGLEGHHHFSAGMAPQLLEEREGDVRSAEAVQQDEERFARPPP